MNVIIFGFDKSYPSSMMNLFDIFSMARQFLPGKSNALENKEITVRLASVDGKPILCQHGILLNVHCSIEEIKKVDVFIVTAIHDLDTALSKNRFVVEWLKDQHARGTTLASVCTGAFLLAETGLLDGKEATTHWSAANSFRERYPQILLNTEKLLINHGALVCAGGAGSSPDLAYCFLEKYLGHTVAATTAKHFVHDFRRASQHIYTIFEAITDHGDLEILRTQQWISRHLSDQITIGELSQIAGMSYRSFERRFKRVTEESPLVYIQRMRVEVAKQKLETTNLSFDEISYQMGYENSGSFRKIFVRWVNLLPSEYRKRFRAYR